jgi:CXXX repeat radical SAM target protein
MNEKENVTRRKFLKDSSRKALAGTAAAFLGISMIEQKAAQAAGCVYGCAGDCTFNCEGDCTYNCKDDCITSCNVNCSRVCSDDCFGSCADDCVGSCSGSCYSFCQGKSSPSGANPQAQHGTPVSKREASSRHVTV